MGDGDDPGRIPGDDWRTVVASVPVVCVDLVVYAAGGVVLGKRANEPAKGEWWVPGGRVYKGEKLYDAAHRIAQAELGIEVKIHRQLGVYEHVHDESGVAGVESKHAIVVAFEASALGEVTAADDQHDVVRAFGAGGYPPLRGFVWDLLRDADAVSDRGTLDAE